MAQSRGYFRFLVNNRMMLGWALAASVAPAYGAQVHKAAAQDIYPATESETLTVDAPVAVRRPLKQAAGIAMPHQSAPSRTFRSVAKPQADAVLTYDLVPSDQVDPLGKRLQLVEILIRKYSRAYDYRAHTVQELVTILAKLDAASAPKTTMQQTTQAMPAAPGLPTPSEEDEVSGGGENPHNTAD